jgi:hypothetical protein
LLRNDVTEGAAELGADVDEQIALCIEAMKAVAREPGWQ